MTPFGEVCQDHVCDINPVDFFVLSMIFLDLCKTIWISRMTIDKIQFFFIPYFHKKNVLCQAREQRFIHPGLHKVQNNFFHYHEWNLLVVQTHLGWWNGNSKLNLYRFIVVLCFGICSHCHRSHTPAIWALLNEL